MHRLSYMRELRRKKIRNVLNAIHSNHGKSMYACSLQKWISDNVGIDYHVNTLTTLLNTTTIRKEKSYETRKYIYHCDKKVEPHIFI